MHFEKIRQKLAPEEKGEGASQKIKKAFVEARREALYCFHRSPPPANHTGVPWAAEEPRTELIASFPEATEAFEPTTSLSAPVPPPLPLRKSMV